MYQYIHTVNGISVSLPVYYLLEVQMWKRFKMQYQTAINRDYCMHHGNITCFDLSLTSEGSIMVSNNIAIYVILYVCLMPVYDKETC